MKCISIKQPWAWLIAAGHKDIENRGWVTAFRGECFIHASACMTHKEFIECWKTVANISPILAACMPSRINLLRGGIIGKCEIYDVVRQSESPWFSGPVGWRVRNAMHFSQLHPMKGQLQFFDVEEKIVYHYELINCPACACVQQAMVEHMIPFASYVHECTECGYIITESDWEVAPTERNS